MSFRATVDMVMNFSYIQVRFLQRQGFLRYRAQIYMKYQDKVELCQPYNIVRAGPKAEFNTASEQAGEVESEIDKETMHYYSQAIPVKYRPASYEENETVFFKAYISTDIIDDVEYFCVIECLFAETLDTTLQVACKFEAKIRKIFGVSTFLPVVFDAFEGFMIFSTFHSTILEFKFHEDEASLPFQNSPTVQSYNSFYSYLKAISKEFDRKELLQFYEYYWRFLQRECQVIVKRHYELIKRINNEQIDKQSKNEISGLDKNADLVTKIIGRSIYEAYKEAVPLTIADKQEIVEQISKDLVKIKGQIYSKWMQFLNFLMANSKTIAKHYRKDYHQLCNERFKGNVFSHRIKNHDWRVSRYSDSGKTNEQQAFIEKQKTATENQLWQDYFPVENVSYFGHSSTHIKMFEEIYQVRSTHNQLSPAKSAKHLIILVHGFHASRQDFLLFKSCLEVMYGVHALISTCNEGLTESSIVLAGKRLANEVKKILASQAGQYRLSFIGHSMGGLIIRSALPDLAQHSDRFYLYMSFSTPHLGYLYQSSTLIKAGLWFLTKWNKIEALSELSMQDSTNLRQTVLYKLAQNGGLNKFRKLCFVCSSLDEYVVYESARAEQNVKLMSETMDAPTQKIVTEMVEGMLGDVQVAELSRINVVFNIKDRNLDSFLGRTGHIKFLCDVQFIREFCSCFDQFFS